MALEPKDRAQLLKLLGMTGSEHDGEALNALRMALTLMKRCKVTWADLIGTPAKSADDRLKDAYESAFGERPGARPQYRYESTPAGRSGGSDFFRDAWERAHRDHSEPDPFADMLKRAMGAGGVDIMKLWTELQKQADAGRADSTTRQAHEDLNTEEKRNVALARLRLDEILKRDRMDALKRQHFESIRSRHVATGYINPTHRSQIDRAYYTQGWDGPVSGKSADKVVIEEVDDFSKPPEGKR